MDDHVVHQTEHMTTIEASAVSQQVLEASHLNALPTVQAAIVPNLTLYTVFKEVVVLQLKQQQQRRRCSLVADGLLLPAGTCGHLHRGVHDER